MRFDSGLAYALGNGKTEVIEVFHEVLKDLSERCPYRASILIALSDMLAAKGRRWRTGHSGTHAGMDMTPPSPPSRRSSPIPAIQPHISQDLVDPHSSGPAMAIPGGPRACAIAAHAWNVDRTRMTHPVHASPRTVIFLFRAIEGSMPPHPLSGSSASSAALWLPDVRRPTRRVALRRHPPGAPRLSYSAQEYHSHADFS